MKVYIVRDSDFTLKGAAPASYLLHYDAYAKRFLSSFDEVVLVGRLFEREDPTALVATGPGVAFVGLPGYHGPLGFLKALPKIVRTVWSTLDRDAAYILRIPATIPTLYSVLLRLRGIPFTVEVAADPYDGYSKQALNNSKLAPMFRSLFVRATKWQCQTAVASAYVTREALQKRYPPRDPATSFSFTSIDLRDEAFVAAPRAADSFPLQGLHMVMIGNMQKTLKGHDTLIEAIARLKQRGIDVTATVIGFGESLATFKELATRLGVGDRLTFTGKLQNGGPVRDMLDTGDLFVLPSRQEGLPRAMLEAMARGLPAVASRVGGTPELIDEKYLFEAGDIDGLVERIAAFAGNREALAAASARNLEVARTYHATIVTSRRTAFFDRVASLSGR
jgi:glycosyltransferase involved in cell wall biosynthesis